MGETAYNKAPNNDFKEHLKQFNQANDHARETYDREHNKTTIGALIDIQKANIELEEIQIAIKTIKVDLQEIAFNIACIHEAKKHSMDDLCERRWEYALTPETQKILTPAPHFSPENFKIDIFSYLTPAFHLIQTGHPAPQEQNAALAKVVDLIVHDRIPA